MKRESNTLFMDEDLHERFGPDETSEASHNAESEWLFAGEGYCLRRMVCREWGNDEVCVSLQFLNSDGTYSYGNGFYTQDMGVAEEHFLDKCELETGEPMSPSKYLRTLAIDVLKKTLKK